MKLKKNMSNPMRVLYVIFGAAMIAAPFLFGLTGWPKVVMPVIGVMSFLAGAVGY